MRLGGTPMMGPHCQNRTSTIRTDGMSDEVVGRRRWSGCCWSGEPTGFEAPASRGSRARSGLAGRVQMLCLRGRVGGRGLMVPGNSVMGGELQCKQCSLTMNIIHRLLFMGITCEITVHWLL
jgi:hypothetical protein